MTPRWEDSWRAIRVDISRTHLSEHRQPGDTFDRKTHPLGRRQLYSCLRSIAAGGSPTASMRLANYLADLDPAQRRTVAYVP